MNDRIRLLISAYAVSPARGSECAVGWEITTRLGKYFDVTVLFCKETPSKYPYYTEIEDYLKNKPIENVNFVPVEMPATSKKYTRLHNSGFWPAYYWGYKCWQKEAFRVAKHLHELERFDVAYQLNMIGFREPGYLWNLDIPFIWGPINGFHSIPFSFIRSFKGKVLFLQTIKHIANETQIRISDRARKAAKKAVVVWCVDQTSLTWMKRWQANSELLQETGLEQIPVYLKSNRHYDGDRCLNLVWSGLLNTGKVLCILIDALIKIKNLNFHLTVIGDGPIFNEVKKQAEPLMNKITWLGWLKKADAIEEVKKSDLLIHTSLKEGTPHSILEALGMGIPVVCHDICGMASIVNEKNGFKIPYENYKTSVDFIAELIAEIHKNPVKINELYKTVWSTTDELTWDSKVKKIANKIQNITNNSFHQS